MPDFTLRYADVRTSQGRILEILPPGAIADAEGEIDMEGDILVPGFIDMHIHGCAGVDFSSAADTAACLDRMSLYLQSKGVAAFAPAAMTMPYDELCGLMERYRLASQTPMRGAALAGIYLEGPFLSAEKCAAQPAEFMMQPDAAKLRTLHRLSGGNIRIVCVAPEADGAEAFIKEAAEICRVSAAHTGSDYATGVKAVKAGVSNATHLYNAMNDVARREPGCAGALLESSCFCELICDGIHLHPAVIRLTHRIVGAERLCIVSDGMAATGLGEGTFTLGTQTVTVRRNEARLENGSLAGSVTDIRSAFLKALEFGIPFADALRAVTINPARALGIDGYLGSIEVGKSARLTRLNRTLVG
ncbi:MAG: N-acetylglucosamine-6-phosphate deacetylase [Clostridia bacterium]|nr:N-acetylglucosamine-6-phosphate deacetylase [Clostridia bacterium]